MKELYLEKLQIKESAKHVLKDYFSGKLQTFAESYNTIIENIQNELEVLKIYKWLKERLENKRLDAFIVPDK